MLAQGAQRGCGVSTLGDAQKSVGDGSEQCGLGDCLSTEEFDKKNLI